MNRKICRKRLTALTTVNNLEEWLSYLEGLHPTEIDLGLERIRQVADVMLLSAGNARVITVAGTNGKGTSCALLDAFYSRNGYRTGRYSSPHIHHFSERVTVAGSAVSDKMLTDAFAFVESCRKGVSLTYFEFTTLAAFHIFSQSDLDVWVLEVGLGGRLDAVNIIEPDIAVITSVALDHCDWLGPDTRSIGREKAGIMRPEKAAVCGERLHAEGVLEVAEESGAVLYLRDRDFGIRHEHGSSDFSWWGSSAETAAVPDPLPVPAIPLDNAATVIQVISLMNDRLPADMAALSGVLAELSVPGRYERRIWKQHRLILDVAHNPQAAEHLARRLLESESTEKPVYLVLGMLKDKDCRETLRQLQKVPFARMLLISLDVPRGQSGNDLLGLLPDRPDVTVFPDVASALDDLDTAMPGTIVVCGSFYTVAQVPS